MFGREFVKSDPEIRQIHVSILDRQRCQPRGEETIAVWHLMTTLAKLAVEFVSKNCMQPGSNEWMFAHALTSVCCTRSSERSALLVRDNANARNRGMAASISAFGSGGCFISIRCFFSSQHDVASRGTDRQPKPGQLSLALWRCSAVDHESATVVRSAESGCVQFSLNEFTPRLRARPRASR